MKNIKALLFIAIALYGLQSCGPKYGCPTSGAAIGAERLLSGDPKAAKAAKKAPKFKAK